DQKFVLFSSRRRHTSSYGDWSSDVCSSDLVPATNRGTRVRQAPTRTAAFSPQVCPNEWNSGSPPKMTSSGPMATRSVANTSTLRSEERRVGKECRDEERRERMTRKGRVSG